VTTKVNPGERLQLRAVVAVSRCNETDLPSGHGAGLGDKGSPCEAMTNRSTQMFINVVTEAIQQGSNTEGACTGPSPYKNAFIDVLGGLKHELHTTCFGPGASGSGCVL